jgi:hypothetical protein
MLGHAVEMSTQGILWRYEKQDLTMRGRCHLSFDDSNESKNGLIN